MCQKALSIMEEKYQSKEGWIGFRFYSCCFSFKILSSMVSAVLSILAFYCEMEFTYRKVHKM